jgi:hypothetical protein
MTIPNYDVDGGNKAINSAIRSIRRSQETNNVRVHNVMCLIAKHAEVTGDCDGFRRLLNGLPAGLARCSSIMIKTMVAYTPIQARPEKGGTFAVSIAKPNSQNYKDYNLTGLRENPWFMHEDAKKDPTLVSMDSVGDKLLKMADSILRKIKKGEAEEGERDQLIVAANSIRAFAKTIVPTSVPDAMNVVQKVAKAKSRKVVTANDTAVAAVAAGAAAA